MFKRLNRARALRDELEDQVDESEPVTLEAALDEDSASDSDVGSDSDDDEDDENDEEESEDDVDEDKFTVTQALESPVYLDDEANLRSEKAIEVHLDSKAHKRRYTRFVRFAEAEKEREGDRVLLLDPRVLVDLLEDERRKEEKAAEAK
ncbi:hypothetical protein MBRA1_001982 [Malassezia brasiliensis]|uniref:Uncharacterized protein n=1 Tax=Malassezia brasiliensis TaxID=1821822 RepID=A0AAF0DXB1_9BASI|nr:hypothetical protein MBRA1_001982 [Malassezia brasiliensis]